VLTFERQWISSHLSRLQQTDGPTDLPGLQERLTRLIAAEQDEPAMAAQHVAEQMPLVEFRILVQQFALDGLTEAQVFYYILPRLSLAAQMPMLRIMIDEFGCGNLQRAHTSLYIQLLHELNLPTQLGFYIDRTGPACLAFVNLFFWLTLRADDPSYFAGALTYLEATIPAFFMCYVQACERLGIQAHHYYSEHRHIDTFHAIEGQRLLRVMHATGELSPHKAWIGMQLASDITARAFTEAVQTARSLGTPLDCEGTHG
jgi:hypothetical protein